MLIKKAKYEICRDCGRSKGLHEDEVYGCDTCKAVIDLHNKNNKRHHDFLSLTIHYLNSSKSSKGYEFCSWPCVLKKLKTIKTDYFVSLPYLSFEKDVEKGQSAKDFFKAIKAFK